MIFNMLGPRKASSSSKTALYAQQVHREQDENMVTLTPEEVLLACCHCAEEAV